MSNDQLETAISSLETDAKAAEDRIRHHLDRVAYHTQEAEACKMQATVCRAAIHAINRVRGVAVPLPTPHKLPSLAQEEARKVFVAVEAPATESPFRSSPASSPSVYNGASQRGTVTLDRDTLRRELRARNIYYPLGKSHRDIANFVRQSTIAACMNHPDYKTYVEAGGFDLSNNLQRHGHMLRHAVETLGVDKQKVHDDASVLHNLIYTCGEKDRDYR